MLHGMRQKACEEGISRSPTVKRETIILYKRKWEKRTTKGEGEGGKGRLSVERRRTHLKGFYVELGGRQVFGND